MKRIWNTAEREEHWTLSTEERQAALDNKTDASRLGFALLLKWFEYEGRFPTTRSDVPTEVISYLARQLNLSESVFADYDWGSRTMERHRSLIRERLGFHEATTEDAEVLPNLISGAFATLGSRSIESARQFFYEQCKNGNIEPPSTNRVERIIRSGLHQGEIQLADRIASRLPVEARMRLDRLMEAQVEIRSEEDSAVLVSRSALQHLREASGSARLETILEQIDPLLRRQLKRDCTRLMKYHPWCGRCSRRTPPGVQDFSGSRLATSLGVLVMAQAGTSHTFRDSG